MTYSEFQNQPSSEKITLAFLQASKRLMGWSVHSGTVYKLENFDPAVIVSMYDSSTALIAVDDIGSVDNGKYYHDKANKTIYLTVTDDSNPNGRYIVVTVNFFFANVPITLPSDLDSADEVYFESLIASTSEFGAQMDVTNQVSEAIEGSGSLTLINDIDFWPSNFDKYTFENQVCELYSYNRELLPSEARLIFRGNVEKKTYSDKSVVFQLKDQFAELRAPVDLETIGTLDERTPSDLTEARQRLVLGRVFGHRPTNIDQVVDGYPVTGTISISNGSTSITGVGTSFLSELSPDDSLVLGGEEYSIATISTDTALELSEVYTGSNLSGVSIVVLPDSPKRHMNRIHLVAGHSTCEPTTVTETGCTVDRLFVESNQDIYEGDVIYIGELGSGETATVQSILGTKCLQLSTSLATVPAEGVLITRPSVQNVRINRHLLVYERDYSYDAETAILTLSDDAEKNISPILHLPATVSFTDTSRTVTGSGFDSNLESGYMLGIVGHTEYFEILSVESDTSLTLRTPATFTDSDTGRYKPLIYDEGDTILSLDCLGRTDDGTPSGTLLKTAPSISKALLEDIGFETRLNSPSFVTADNVAYQHLGLVVPDSFSDTSVPTYREVLNSVNKSVFGAVVQNSDFELEYQVLKPNKLTTAVRFSESDILSFSFNANSEFSVKTSIVEYKPKEYDYETEQDSVNTAQKTSDVSTYVLKTDRTRTIETRLVNAREAKTMANRWSFILETSTGNLTFVTKMQGFNINVGDIIEVEHRKFFERVGGSSTRKLVLVEAVKRSGTQVKIDATDLSNSFNRVACINEYTNDWSTATEDELVYGGYITDEYGLIDNDPDSFGSNLIW